MYLIKTKVKESPIGGKGYFADENIPIGTIAYLYGEKDIRYSKDKFEKLAKKKKEYVLEYGVEDEFGNWVVTATGPYTNHSCDPNLMALFVGGYYTNIVVRNISEGDEITVDYAQMYSSESYLMECKCGSNLCRNEIGFGNTTDYRLEMFWEKSIQSAIEHYSKVEQPIHKSKDKYAKEISTILKGLNKPTLGKQIKYSLIEKGT